ncbi:MAG TPA: acyl-CoA dehydrogenase family protein, partial [Myxococcales bacterium]|nr:acyl-CoA dehydrogenase family protein [Myxococcales bacterium]
PPDLANWFASEPALQRILHRQLGEAFDRARPRLSEMGRAAANEVSQWAQVADRQGPRLVQYDREGRRIDEVEYHPAYRRMQQVAYGGGIVAAGYDPALAGEHGGRPRALAFGLGYLFATGEAGLYCPVCMTDGAARLLRLFGSPELKDRYVPRLASMDLATLYTGAMFLTEQEGGSDVGQVQTSARPDGSASRLTGQKWFCSNVDADVVMILARPEGAPEGTRGLGLYCLPRTLPDGGRNRYRIDRLKEKLGVRSMPTGEVTLEGALAYPLGEPGQGFHQMAEMLNLSRLYNAVGSAAGMRRSFLEAYAWASRRVAFGQKLVEHPLMSETLLDLAAEQRGALAWVFRAVELLDRADAGAATAGEARALRLLTPMVKAYTAKKAVWAASEGLEVLGGNGYIEDWPMARVLRDAQVLPIWEGATSVLVLDAFRAIRKSSAHEAFFEEVQGLVADAPAPVQERLGELLDQLSTGLSELYQEPSAEHMLRDWTWAASLVWEAALLSSKKAGHGSEADVRAARRLLARNAPVLMLRGDRATPEDVTLVGFGP